LASEELQALLEMMRSRPVPEQPPTLEEMRANFELMAQPAAADVRCEPVDAGGVPAEWLTPEAADPERAILYLHGGGYVIGSINTHREMASRIARASGALTLLIDYRLAPEHPFPAAVEDAAAAYRWLLGQGIAPERLVIAGDSAGGGLTVATLVALRDAGDPLPAAGVCLSPWVDLEGIGESMTTKAESDPNVQRALLAMLSSAYLAGADPRSALAAPLYADLTGLPPLLIQVGTSETLLDDSTRLAAKAEGEGVTVTLRPYEDMIHVFQMFPVLPEAQQAVEEIGAFVRRQAGAAAAV
jgi:epsilon-lactone hydrolase